MILPRDKDGYLLNRDDWSEAIAENIAQEEKITLSDEHWQLINFLRNFYREYNTFPTMRILVKEIKTLHLDKANSLYLHGLFPKGVIRQASKIAGLPKPPKCQ